MRTKSTLVFVLKFVFLFCCLALSACALNDTGQTVCVNAVGAPVSCSGTGQDGEFGRDANLSTNTSSDGSAGFSFIKMDASGSFLNSNASSWDCVYDRVTGLQWENKVNNSTQLRHGLHTYTWFNTNAGTNGGSAGSIGSNTCNATLSGSFCNTQAYISAINTAGLCSRNDWRLPTRSELLSISHFGVASPPTIDLNYFPNTFANQYWTSDTMANQINFAWVSYLQSGATDAVQKIDHKSIRLVRSFWKVNKSGSGS